MAFLNSNIPQRCVIMTLNANLADPAGQTQHKAACRYCTGGPPETPGAPLSRLLPRRFCTDTPLLPGLRSTSDTDTHLLA